MQWLADILESGHRRLDIRSKYDPPGAQHCMTKFEWEMELMQKRMQIERLQRGH
ncbi:MAG: hypothetical protein JWO65_916 [Sphingomonas bacterium]|nr:hypothetical protein [Sphingomonas bacterium]